MLTNSECSTALVVFAEQQKLRMSCEHNGQLNNRQTVIQKVTII